MDSDEFQRDLRRGRPLRIEQRIAADQLIAQIEKTLAKRTYDEPLEKYGYRTTIVDKPLWFAVPPNDPFQVEDAADDFMAGMAPGLEEIKHRMLRRPDDPFGKIIVESDTTPQAWCAMALTVGLALMIDASKQETDGTCG